MRLWIPEPGSTFALTEDWTFPLLYTDRNRGLWKYLDVQLPEKLDPDFVHRETVTIPKDSVLRVLKYDIKKGAASVNNIQFRLDWCPLSPRRTKALCTFTAALSDVCRAEIVVQEDVTTCFIPPVGSSAYRGEIMTFGEFNRLTKDTKK